MRCNSAENNFSLEIVGPGDDGETQNSMNNFRLLVLALNLLEVQLGQHVQVVGQLDDEEQLVQEAHRVVRVVLPQQRELAEEAVADHHVGAPQEGHQVEEDQLARLVETVQLVLGQMQLAREFLKSRPSQLLLPSPQLRVALLNTHIQQVLLENRVHYDADERVEEHGAVVLPSRLVQERFSAAGERPLGD